VVELEHMLVRTDLLLELVPPTRRAEVALAAMAAAGGDNPE
jgi:hypothetical protein